MLAAFEPFGGETINPSWEVARLLSEAPPERTEIASVELPVAFGEDVRRAWAMWDRFAPDLVVGLGQCGGAAEIRIERYAHNLMSEPAKRNGRGESTDRDEPGGRPEVNSRAGRDAPSEETATASGEDDAIVPTGPAAYAATIAVSRLAARLRQASVPAAASRDAGEYLCNHFFYQALHRASSHTEPARVGFVHLPYLPEQAVRHPGRPSLSLEVMAAGVRLLLESVRDEPPP